MAERRKTVQTEPKKRAVAAKREAYRKGAAPAKRSTHHDDATLTRPVQSSGSAITLQYRSTRVLGLFVNEPTLPGNAMGIAFHTALRYAANHDSEQMEVTCEVVGTTLNGSSNPAEEIVLQSVSAISIEGLKGIKVGADGLPALPAWAYATLASIVVGINRGILLERLRDTAYDACTLPIQSIKGLVPAGAARQIEDHGI